MAISQQTLNNENYTNIYYAIILTIASHEITCNQVKPINACCLSISKKKLNSANRYQCR